MSNHGQKHKSKKRLIRNIVSTVLSFVLAMFLAVLMCVVAVQFGFFDRDMILSKINESDYYNQVYAELKENIHTILLSKSIPEDIADECINDKRVYINGKQYIDNSLHGKETSVMVDAINEELNEALLNYYEDNGIEVDEIIADNISATIKDIDSEYIRMIRFQFVDYIKDYQKTVQKVLCWLIPLLIVLSVISIIVLLKIHRYPHRGVRYTAIALASASLINLLLPLYCILNKVYDNLGIQPDYYQNFLEAYMKWSCYAFVYVGAFGFVLTGVLLGCVRVLKHRIG